MKTLHVRGYRVESTESEDRIYDLDGNEIDVDTMDTRDFNAICDALYKQEQEEINAGPFSHVVPLKRYERITKDS